MTITPSVRAGVVGLGSMGSGMAASLIRAGIETSVLDYSPASGEALRRS